jgi:hypothetical protein
VLSLFGRKPRSLVASAAKISDPKQSEYAKRVAQPWQNRALEYYDRCGEINFSGKFYARMLSRCRFFPATLRDDGAVEEITTGPPVDLLNRIQDPGGGRSRLQYDYGRLMFLTGEGILFGSGQADDGSQGDSEKWRFVWRDEVVFKDGVAVRKDATGKETDEQGVGYRMWTPHPKHSDLADSPVNAVLDIAEELIILTASVRGTATTRLTNGIFAIPSEISPNSLVEPGQEEDPEANRFLSAFIEHVTAQVENPSAPESKVPFIFEAAYEYLDRLRWIQTSDPKTDYLERDLRIEAIKRMAIDLDLPPEALLGMSDANHWTAQQVQYDMWRAHGASIASQFGGDICAAYLRPALLEASYAEAARVVIGYDDSQVVISPDRTSDADSAFDRGMISPVGYRKLKGIDESLAPTEEEQKFMLAMHTRNLAAIGINPPAKETGNPSGPPAPPSTNGKGGDAPPPPTDGRVVSRQEVRASAILGAASLALRACRAKAGAKLRSDFQPKSSRHSKGCPDCAEKIDGVPNAIVASALGAELLEEMGRRDPISLVSGGTDDFRDILSEWGVLRADAEVLCQRLEAYAAKTLFEPGQPELPPGFASLVEQLSEAVA